MSAADRAARTAAADTLCTTALEKALAGSTSRRSAPGIALVAVGGYGRGDLAPHSDLDVVLVHDDDVSVDAVAASVWYPLWDAGARLDHAVRALSEVTHAASADPRVTLGLLDARHVSGDPGVTLRLRAGLLAQWRRDARSQLPLVRRLVEDRAARVGELAHLTVPDLKEAFGGLRDVTVLSALVATWLVDVPHGELGRARRGLLDVRDHLHEVNGRAVDRVAPDTWPELADRLGLPDEVAAQRHVRGLGRRVAHLSRLTWRRVDDVLERPRGGQRRPQLVPVAAGVAVSRGEVVLDRGADPERDPALLLRAAAVASERGLVLAPTTAARLVRSGTRPGEPWGRGERDLLVRLLAGGPALVPVWETLEETGAIDLLLPEWERVRLLPHASTVHRFTVDRHSVESCVEASRLLRRVRRPDVLLVAALLHDIGKGSTGDHSLVGEPTAAAVARRTGFSSADAALVGRLVREHLLLPRLATTRDLEDPATVEEVVARVGDMETLDLLAVLTEADARATSTQAWTRWRAGLVADLVGRVRARLSPAAGTGSVPEGRPTSPAPEDGAGTPTLGGRACVVRLHPVDDGTVVTVSATDRIGLVADVADALLSLRLSVRAARVWTEGDVGSSAWEVAQAGLDEAVVRERVTAVLAGRHAATVRPGVPGARPREPEPVVLVDHDASRHATVLEVRTEDRPGVLAAVCRALASRGLSVRSAHASTWGPQAVDVLYVTEPGAGALGDERAAEAAHAVRAALTPTATLGP